MLERLGVNTPKPIVYRELRSHIANLPNVEHHLHTLQCRLIMIQEVARVGASQDGEMSLLPATRESLARCSALAQRASDLTFSVRRELATWGSGTICATLLSPVDYPPLSEFREAKREQLLSTDLWHATEKWCAECKETIARALRSLDYLARLYRVDSKLFVRHARRYDQNEASWIGVIKNNAGARQRATADLVSLLSTDLADEVSALERSLHPALPSINQELDEFELVLQRFERGIESSLMEGSDNDLPPEAANHLRRAPHLTAFIRERLGVVKNANPSAAHDDATVDFDVTSEDWEPPLLETNLGSVSRRCSRESIFYGSTSKQRAQSLALF